MKTTIHIITGLLLLIGSSTSAMAESEGVIRLKSPHSAKATIDKLEKVLKAKGMTIFKRVPHHKGAAKVGLKLRPTDLLIFGNPKVGTPLMLCEQMAALDLPQKALAYEDKSGQTWLVYNDPTYMAKRHKVKGCEASVKKITGALKKLTGAALK